MERQQREQALRARMETTRREYNELNESYDSILSEAHKFDHGTREMVEALQRANLVAPRLSVALQKHSRAVEALSRFYLSQRG
jgi:hypothetical protein